MVDGILTRIEWQQFIGDNHRFLDTDEKIRHNLSKTDIPHTVPVITYCRVEMRATVGYIALQRLGYDVRLYDGSYSESQSSGLPVET